MHNTQIPEIKVPQHILDYQEHKARVERESCELIQAQIRNRFVYSGDTSKTVPSRFIDGLPDREGRARVDAEARKLIEQGFTITALEADLANGVTIRFQPRPGWKPNGYGA